MWRITNQAISHVPKDEQYSEYEGIRLPLHTAKVVEDLKTWEVRHDDVWIITYPKSGTIWTQEITSAVMHDGNLDAIRARHVLFRVVYIDKTLPAEIRRLKNVPDSHRLAEEISSPRVLRSHLPGPLLPLQLWEKKPRIIYVMRNFKDVAVSYFYFMKMAINDRATLNQSFGEFLDEMMSGKVPYGTWWEHVLFFWKRRHEKNILFLRYEDLKADLRGNVEKICNFLGKDLSAASLDAITQHCSFTAMKSNPMAHIDLIFDRQGLPEDVTFMRKGEVGDWKLHFTVAQNEVVENHIEEKIRGSGLTIKS
ncbi:estrogen sulfotransferase-like isoform X2 [Acanthaster planci]|nr:estrogen sulfotransferase-like isoform X2 [Acanthaster planci]XP_022101812.1 estrogen sulfotransferase-like isoform X2 [Acanthaster planci]